MTARTIVATLVAVLLFSPALPAAAFDPDQAFAKGTFLLSVEAGGGKQDSVEGHTFQTGLEFWNAGVRLGWLPFGPSPSGVLHGALEIGLEPYYQRYVSPLDASFGGLGVDFRYHFLSLGRVVPWVEVFGAAGGTDLKTREIRSTFTFLVHGGAGLSVFVTDRAAVYAGYRLQHVSNGNVESPNRGFESHTGVLGVSVLFP